MKITQLIPANNLIPRKSFFVLNNELKIISYPPIKHWYFKIINVDGISEYHSLDLSGSILIRGVPKATLLQPALRKSSNFIDQGTNWIMLDIDGFNANCDRDGVQQFIERELPAEFQNVTCSVAFSASAGIEQIKPGLNAHLMYALSRSLTGQEIKIWLRGCPIDFSLYSAVQPHYVTDPFLENVTCTLTERKFLLIGEHDMVIPPVIKIPKTTSKVSFKSSSGKKPKLNGLMQCDFVRYFLYQNISDGDGRYEAFRAFFHSAMQVREGPELVAKYLDDYVHSDAIIRSIEGFPKPITCASFLPKIKFQCPHFKNGQCAKFNVTSPAGVAWKCS